MPVEPYASTLQSSNIGQNIQPRTSFRPRNHWLRHQCTLHIGYIKRNVRWSWTPLMYLLIPRRQRWIGRRELLSPKSEISRRRPAGSSRRSAFPHGGWVGDTGFGRRGFLDAAGAGLGFVVRFEVLLHVVCARELLLAAGVRAVDCLLRGVDFGVAGCVARGCECFLAVVHVAVPAWVALDSCVGGVFLVGRLGVG